MTKKTTSGSQKPPMPFVSVCTPTFNRRPFIPMMFECFRNQKYPKHRLEWIIIDDGTDKIQDLVEKSKIPQIKYYPVEKKMTLGAKRNMMHDKAKGSIIVYMDDDDYYPPERIIHAVEKLQANPTVLCAGSSEIYLYFKQIKKMYQFGPYSANHATAATFAFRRELLQITRYDDKACIAEEKAFLKNYTIPFVQLDPLKTILVFSHEHNSFDKRRLLENPPPQFVKESNKTIDMFIKNSSEENIKQFFMKDIDELLAKYEPGEPKMKPDVLKQMKEIEVERKKIEAQMQQQHQQQMQQNPQMAAQYGEQPQIMMQEPGKPPVPITLFDAVNIINKQQQELIQCQNHIKTLEANASTVSVSMASLNELTKLRQKNLELENKILELENQNRSMQSKSVSFKEGESIVLPSGKSAVNEVVKLKEKILELENQIKKSKNLFADALSKDTKQGNQRFPPRPPPSIVPEQGNQRFPLQPPPSIVPEIVPEAKDLSKASKLEPEIKININNGPFEGGSKATALGREDAGGSNATTRITNSSVINNSKDTINIPPNPSFSYGKSTEGVFDSANVASRNTSSKFEPEFRIPIKTL
jgi:glycosyltransferase involved in cell wall biosynthesis